MTRNRPTAKPLRERLFGSKLAVPVDRIQACRSVFESADVQRIDINFVTDNAERLTLECKPKQVAELIVQLTIAYNAINPPLPTGQGQATHWGMQ